MLKTLPSLPDDVLYIIKKDLDFASTMALRSACRQLYSIFPDPLLLSEIVLTSTLTQQQFDKLFSYLLSTNKTQHIRKLTFNRTQITEKAIISVLEHCKNLQKLYILACNQVKLLPITNSMVKWHQDETGNSPDLKELKNIIMTRCIGGKRHSLMIKKVLEDLRKLKSKESKESSFQQKKNNHDNDNDNNNNNNDNNNNNNNNLNDDKTISAKIKMILNTTNTNDYSTKTDDTNDGMFQFQSCQVETCEYCTMSCVSCKVKYKYWDEFWIKCGWCKERDFCGPCVLEASKKNTIKNYAFQFMRIKLCQIFDLPCPF